MDEDIRQRVGAAALARARRAEQRRAWAEAAIAHETAAAADPTSPRRWLDLARCRFRAGDVELAWEACLVAARLGRSLADPTVLAEAATIIEGPGAEQLREQIHALCREAEQELGDTHPMWRARVRDVIRRT